MAVMLLAVVAVVATIQGDVEAQTRPALVRDIDNPALQPFREPIFISLGFNETSKIVDGPVAPAGKRLVIENISVWGFTAGTDEFTGVWLTVKNVSPSVFVLLDPATTERKPIGGGSFVIAYNRQVKLYFNPGETIQAQVFVNTNSTPPQLLNIYLQGYYVTL